MKVSELYKKYNNLKKEFSHKTNDSYDKEDFIANAYELFEKSIKIKECLPVSQKIIILRDAIRQCSKEINDYSYIDHSLFSISLLISTVSAYTDLDIDTSDDVKEGDYALTNYDMLERMGIEDFLTYKNEKEMDSFYKVWANEQDNFMDMNKLSAVIDKKFGGLFKSLSGLIDSLTNAIDSFESINPEQIDSARNLLSSMNESVEKIIAFNDRKKDS